MIAPIDVPAITRRLDAKLVEGFADEDVRHAAGAAAAERKTDTQVTRHYAFPFAGEILAGLSRRDKTSLRLNLDMGG